MNALITPVDEEKKKKTAKIFASRKVKTVWRRVKQQTHIFHLSSFHVLITQLLPLLRFSRRNTMAVDGRCASIHQRNAQFSFVFIVHDSDYLIINSAALIFPSPLSIKLCVSNWRRFRKGMGLVHIFPLQLLNSFDETKLHLCNNIQ